MKNMDETKAVHKLREKYLNLLISTLKENIKKTLENVNVDALVIQHYAIAIEEDCFSKYLSNLATYTRSITAARLNIERCTANQQLYPAISKALHPRQLEKISKQTRTENRGRQNQIDELFVLIIA